jgi:hypothetical protein
MIRSIASSARERRRWHSAAVDQREGQETTTNGSVITPSTSVERFRHNARSPLFRADDMA